MKHRKILRSVGGLVVPSIVMLSGCPGTCAPSASAPGSEQAASPPPAGAQFSEDFSQPASLGRFDVVLDGMHPSSFGDSPKQWEGDHDRSCNGPETSRDVQLLTRQDMSDLVWWCAPGADPAKGHMMTAFTTFGYSILSFSPKQYFTNVQRVCWDQNKTFLGGRKWTQMAVISRADVEREMAEVDDWEVADGLGGGNLNLGFVNSGFMPGVGPTTHVTPTGDSIVVQVGGDALFFHKPQAGGLIGQISGSGSWAYENVANRFQHCVQDNNNGTVTMTMQHPDGQLRTATFDASLPDGQVRVIFQDDQYDGPKDSAYDAGQNTWHWDNINIS